MSLADGELNGAAELTLQAGKVVAYCVANISRLVVELDRSGLHRAPVAQSAARRPIEPVLEQGAQPRESTFGFERGDEHGFGKARRSRLDSGDLQLLARPEMRKQAAFGDTDSLRERTDGQRLEAALAGLRQRRVEDCSARVVALAHERIIRTIVLFVNPPRSGRSVSSPRRSRSGLLVTDVFASAPARRLAPVEVASRFAQQVGREPRAHDVQRRGPARCP